MALPPQLRTPGPGDGKGPFGEQAFRRALIGCIALVAIGALMGRSDSEVVAGVGISLVVLAVVGALTSGLGLLAERLVQRRRSPDGGR
jgi:hypothetical protein